MNAVKNHELLAYTDAFVRRHIGPDESECRAMLEVLGCSSMGELIDRTVPASIRLSRPLQIDGVRSEQEVLAELRTMAVQNKVYRSFIGMGYHDCFTPSVILRNIFENPGWVHSVHPIPAGDIAGKARGAVEFPNHDHRPDRPGCSQCVAAG